MFSVLYVDDEQDLLDLGKLFLEQSPEFRVGITSSARDALALLATQPFDAIVSDYQMPEMDGIAFLKTVRERFGDVPFILFTGRGREDVVIQAINNGVDFYLQKGGDVRAQFAELSHKIRQAVARRKAEISLIESEKRLADIINFLPDATLAINRDGIIIAWNRAIEEMTGLPADAILGKGDHEYALPFYGERRPILIDLIFEPDEVIEQKYAHIVRHKDILIADTTLPRLKGKVVTLLGKASPLYNSQGEIVGAIEAIRDITVQKNAEDELRAAYEQISASEEELREQLDVLEASEKKIRESEARLRYMTGFYEKAKGPEGELLGYAVEGAGAVTESPLGYLAFLNDDESELSMYAWSRSAMKECAIRDKPIVYKTAKTGLWGEAVRQRRAVITNDYAAPNPAKKGYPLGHPEIVRHMNVPIMDSGHIVLVAGVANKPADYTDTDVQELLLLMQSLWLVIKRRRAEGALLESEEKYRDLFENSVLGIFRTTREGKFSAINDTFARIAGYDSPQQMMETIKDVRTQLYVNPEDRDRFVNALQTDGVVKDFEAQYYHRDGHAVWILINAKAVCDSQGEVLYYEGTIEDITGQKNDKDALLREKIFSSAVLESIPGLLYLYDSEGKLVRWNKSHETVSGYTAEELGRMQLLDWFKGDDEAIRVISEGVGRALKEGQSSASANLLTKSGKRIPFFFTAKRLEIEGKTYFTGVGIDITDRQQAQDELRAAYERITASEERYRNVIEFSPSGMHFYELLPDGSLIFIGANPAADTILGVENSSFIGKTIEDAFPGLTGTEIPEQYRKVAAGGGIWHTDQVIYDQGKIQGAYAVQAFQIRPGVVVAVFLDITERKIAEQALREKTEELDQYFTTSLDLFCIADIHGNFRRLNPEWEKALGYTLPELEGHRFLDFVHPDDLPATLEVISQLSNQQDVLNFTNRYRHKDGTFRWIEWRSRPLGELIVAAARDITPRMEIEEALRESEAKYRAIFENIQDVYYLSDADGNLVMASPSITALLGYASLDEVIGKNIARDLWWYPEQRQAFIDEIKKYGSVTNYEVILKRKDGKPVTVATSSHFYSGRDGPIAGVEGIFHDMTAIKTADQQIQLLATLMDISPVSVTVHDPEGRFLYANQRTFDLHGWPRDEFMALNLHQLDVPVSEELINERISQLREHGEVTFDVEHYRRDGSTFPLQVIAKLTRWNDHDVILSVATDISGRIAAEQELREAEKNYRTLVENSQSIIYTILPDGIMTFVSPSWTTLLGHEPSEVVDHDFRNFVHKDDIPACDEFLQKIVESRTTQPGIEYRVFH
ncbi:MAG: PAS domain S-box protein, partial [Methanoregula sp.]|nr:PAS domain S-box protein [Methanoregula sp.]